MTSRTFTDFSNPASSWGMLDSDFVLTEYLYGVYRILSRQSGFFKKMLMWQTELS